MGEVHQKLLGREVTGSWLQEELERAVRDRIRTAFPAGLGVPQEGYVGGE